MVAVLGLDPGARFGFCVYDGVKVLVSGVLRVRLSAKDSLGCRISRLAIHITELCEVHEPAAFAFETNANFSVSGSGTQRLHGSYEGVCAMIAHGLEVPFRTWAPNSLKKAIREAATVEELRREREAKSAAESKDDKQRAGKVLTTLFAERIKGGQVVDDNEADAVCAAWATLQDMVF